MAGTRRRARSWRWGWVLALLGAPAVASGATLSVTVTDSDGVPLEHAVVAAWALDANGKVEPSREPVVIDQIDKEFVPYVSVVRKGTAVTFPNRDPVRHHVYSFSEAKTFEIPLYKGTPPEPVVFDTPGVVPLGCNIHDWMMAYVFVTDAPHFGVTDASGQIILRELAPRRYRVEVWHPELEDSREVAAHDVAVDPDGASLSVSIERRRMWRPRRAPHAGDAGYR
jgi:plastocyanin